MKTTVLGDTKIGHIKVSLFGVFRPNQEVFTHMETSPLPVKGCKFLPMLGTYGH